MKLYSLSSKLDFGEYSGQSLKEVFLKDPDYIEDCIMDEALFCFNPDNIEILEDLMPKFTFLEESIEKLESKFEIFENEENSFDDMENFSAEDLKNLGINDNLSDDFSNLDDGEGGFYEDDFGL
ncbi:MAG: hypothetical protein KAS71_02290 [Bacteroidales bacterium]|nr:hypothetical protein [Bacteroidales bacterium]